MADTTLTPADAVTTDTVLPEANDTVSAKGRFTKAIEEAKAGAEALKGEAIDKGAAYKAKVSETATDWVGEAKVYADQAKELSATLAVEGKAKASDALSTLGKVISDNAGTIDNKLGVQYGDYARTAARSIQETAAKLESKDFGELGNDVKEFVQKSPGIAIGIAAVAGFAIAKMLSGGSDD